MSRLPQHDEPDDVEERLQSYLDELLLALRGRPREARRLLTEVEAHLREAVADGMATGLDGRRAVDAALHRFGPPSAVARGLPRSAAYLSLAGQMIEAAMLTIGALLLAAGAASVPVAMLAMIGKSGLVTGDPPVQSVTPGRCQQLFRMVTNTDCGQALVIHHLQEVVRNHLLGGWLGFVVLGLWWVLHVRRKTRPAVLPAGFDLIACSTLLGVVGLLLLATGIHDVALGTNSTGGLLGSGDLLMTGASVLAAAMLAWLALARQATRPARNLPARA